MAKETKSFICHPAYESEMIEFRQRFGWELFNTQEVYNKDSHLESSFFGNTITSVTETTHYLRLTFQRERDSISQELRDLENDFDNLPVPEEPELYSIVQIFIGLMLCTIPGVIFIISNINRKKEYTRVSEIYDREYPKLMARLNQIGVE